jgi:hypothetical protein
MAIPFIAAFAYAGQPASGGSSAAASGGASATSGSATTGGAGSTGTTASGASSGCIVKGSSSISGGTAGEVTMYTFWNNGKHTCVDYGVKIATNDGKCYVAIPASKIGAKKEQCGKKIQIEYNGKVLEAIVSDICGDCPDNNIDLSQPAYAALTGDNSSAGGRKKCNWKFV